MLEYSYGARTHERQKRSSYTEVKNQKISLLKEYMSYAAEIGMCSNCDVVSHWV